MRLYWVGCSVVFGEANMDFDQLKTDVLKVFHMKATSGIQDMPINNVIYRSFVSYTWMVCVERELVIAGTKMTAPESEFPDGVHQLAAWMYSSPGSPLEPLENISFVLLPAKDDKVGLALQSMNILPLWPGIALGPNANYHHHVFTWGEHSYAHFYYGGNMIQSTNMREFWNAVIERASWLADKYENDKMKQFVRFMYL
jgi:hypothetical protein